MDGDEAGASLPAEPAGTALRTGTAVGTVAGIFHGPDAAVPMAALTAGAVFAQHLALGGGPCHLTAEEQALANAMAADMAHDDAADAGVDALAAMGAASSTSAVAADGAAPGSGSQRATARAAVSLEAEIAELEQLQRDMAAAQVAGGTAERGTFFALASSAPVLLSSSGDEDEDDDSVGDRDGGGDGDREDGPLSGVVKVVTGSKPS